MDRPSRCPAKLAATHPHLSTQLSPLLLHAHCMYSQGFWWSHVGWLFSTESSMLDYANAPDLKAQLFYRVLEVTFFPWLFIVKPYLTYQYGGMEMVCWSIAVPMVAGWHSTFLVNSAAHTWGRQPYDTGEGLDANLNAAAEAGAPAAEQDPEDCTRCVYVLRWCNACRVGWQWHTP